MFALLNCSRVYFNNTTGVQTGFGRVLSWRDQDSPWFLVWHRLVCMRPAMISVGRNPHCTCCTKGTHEIDAGIWGRKVSYVYLCAPSRRSRTPGILDRTSTMPNHERDINFESDLGYSWSLHLDQDNRFKLVLVSWNLPYLHWHRQTTKKVHYDYYRPNYLD